MTVKSKHLKCLLVFSVAVCIFFSTGCNKKNNNVNSGLINKVQRIVVLSPSGAEILCTLGAQDLICARTDYCDYPSSIKNIPSIGGFSSDSVSVESIVSYKPDFVYGSKDMHDSFSVQLSALGIPLYLSKASSLNSVYDEILFIAKLTGKEQKGVELVNEIKNSAELIQKKAAEEKITVYYEVWNTPFMSCGSTSFINDIINVCGGKNIFEEIETPYPVVSEESIIAKNPQVILIPSQNGLTQKDVLSRTGWNLTDAVKNKRIYFVDSDLFSRPGPRITEAMNTLYNYLYTQK